VDRGAGQSVATAAQEISFTNYGKVLTVVVVALYAQAYALNNVAPALIASMVLAYLAFARMSFDEQCRATRLKITRHVKDRAFQGRPFSASVEIHNGSSHAAWVEVQDRLPEEARLAYGRSEARYVIEPGESRELSCMLSAVMRGPLLLDRLGMKVFDERGLMALTVEQSVPSTVKVEPSVEEFKGGRILQRKGYRLRVQTPTLARVGRGYEFAGLRQHIPEDPFTSIEWKASSRLARLMTKLLYEEIRASVYIFLDCARSMRLTRDAGWASKLDQSVQLAVQIATQLSQAGYPVGLGAYDEHRVLAFKSAAHGRVGPTELLEVISHIPKSKVARTGRLGAVISDLQGENADAFISKILPFFGRRRVASWEKAAGIYWAVERLVLDRPKSCTVLVFSDLETNPKSFMLSSGIILRKGHRLVVITPFSPAFELRKEELSVEVLERMYLSYQAKLGLIRRLERMGATVVEVGRGREAPIQISRRLSRM